MEEAADGLAFIELCSLVFLLKISFNLDDFLLYIEFLSIKLGWALTLPDQQSGRNTGDFRNQQMYETESCLRGRSTRHRG